MPVRMRGVGVDRNGDVVARVEIDARRRGPRETTSHQRDAFGAVPSRWKATVVRALGPSVQREVPPDVPHQQVGVESSSISPTSARPMHQCVDDTGQFLAAFGQRVAGASVDLAALNHTGASQDLSQRTTAPATSWVRRGVDR